ncbi:MAG: hypothetical protein LBE01_01100 [Deltaproteobacteria bacterium]|jgi:hypothetical protein|nr:hypothetical protein [Deltaproteobacteria bacterium]
MLKLLALSFAHLAIFTLVAASWAQATVGGDLLEIAQAPGPAEDDAARDFADEELREGLCDEPGEEPSHGPYDESGDDISHEPYDEPGYEPGEELSVERIDALIEERIDELIEELMEDLMEDLAEDGWPLY